MEKGFLAEKEVHKVRPLWEKVFAEDSKKFTEYYFANKAEHNLVFTRVQEDEVVSMLHLAPYVTGRMEPVCYIVGVATEEKFRRQGLMADLLKEALQFMWEEGQTFTFLMPANPAYYTPFQFTYVYDRPEWKLNESMLPMRYLKNAAEYEADFHLVIKEKGSLQIKTAKEEDMVRLAAFANDLLLRNTDCYMLRSARYYKILKKELVAQNGNLFFVEHAGTIKGILAYICENGKPGWQEVLLNEELANRQLISAEEYKPVIMARILRVEDFMNQLYCDGSVDLLVDVVDPILTQNSGIYHIYGENNSLLSCKKRSHRNDRENDTSIKETEYSLTYKRLNRNLYDCQVMLDDLTAFAFGYKSAEECFRIENEAVRDEILDCLEQIRVWRRPFINEIV